MNETISSNGHLVGSNLERILRAGHFAVTGELGPPQSADGDVIRKKAALPFLAPINMPMVWWFVYCCRKQIRPSST